VTNVAEAGYDRDHLREYIRLFPDSPLASMWKGYFAYVEVPLWDDDDKEAPALSPLDDPVDIVMVSLTFFRSHVLDYRSNLGRVCGFI
jgi:superkiller protein 3